MQFSVLSTLALACTTLAAPLQKRESKEFALMTLHSTSVVHFDQIYEVESHPFVFSVGGDEGSVGAFKLEDDGTLKDSNGKAIYVDSATGNIGLVSGDQAASTGFSSVTEGSFDFLHFNGDEDFYACPTESGYSLTHAYHYDGCIGVGLLMDYK